MASNHSQQERDNAVKNLQKKERHLLIQHALLHSGKRLNREELAQVTNIKAGRLNSDIFNLRNDTSSQIEVEHDKGEYFYKFTGDGDALDELPENGVIALNLDVASDRSSAKNSSPKKAPAKSDSANKDARPATEKAKSTSIHSSSSELSLRAKIADFLINQKKPRTIDKIADALDISEASIGKALLSLEQEGAIEKKDFPSFDEAAYVANDTTKKVVSEKEIASESRSSKAEPEKPEPEDKAEVVESKVTSSIAKKIDSTLKTTGKDGGKGKIALIKAAHDAVKASKVPKHDVEDHVISLIADGTLVEAGKDGRGTKYIHKDISVKKDEHTTEQASKKSDPEAKVTKAVEDVASAMPESFDIQSLISDLELSLEEENEAIGPSIAKVFTAIAQRMDKLEAENKKWRQIYSAQVEAMNNAFNK